MPSMSIFFGSLLIIIGIIGYIVGQMDGKASLTALIPAVFGILMIVFGVLARGNEKLRKHLMHGSVLVALLGFIAVAARLVPKLSDLTMSVAVIAQLAMGIICLIFVLLAIRSFAAARSKN